MVELARAWRCPPHTLFNYDDDLLATMFVVLEAEADQLEEARK